jgi:hypothetical protein
MGCENAKKKGKIVECNSRLNSFPFIPQDGASAAGAGMVQLFAMPTAL